MKLSTLILASALVIGQSGLGWAQTTTTLTGEASKMDALAASQGQTKVMGKINSDFSSFLQKVDGPAVVSGLRNGQWTYTTTTTGPTGVATPTTTTVALPTGNMGYGNCYISLALAKQQLSQYGITNPTEAELQAALMGGSITTVNGTTTTTTPIKGILAMRADGMGWGEIAKQIGAKNLGSIMSAMKSANHSMTVASSSSKGSGVGSANQKSGSSESGVISASGKSQGNSGQAGLGKNTSGQGIVTGSGKAAAGVGHAYGHGEGGIVTGSGQAAGAGSGITSAGGRGQGQAKGLDR